MRSVPSTQHAEFLSTAKGVRRTEEDILGQQLDDTVSVDGASILEFAASLASCSTSSGGVMYPGYLW